MKSRTILVAAALLLLPCALVSAAASRKPPLGWSSWYAMGQSVNQSAMEETYLRLTSRSVKPGDSRSLRDVGWTYANLDDGWQACGQGVDGSFHDAAGFPLMDKDKFPNVTAMTEKAHSLGLLPGFYVNVSQRFLVHADLHSNKNLLTPPPELHLRRWRVQGRCRRRAVPAGHAFNRFLAQEQWLQVPQGRLGWLL